jgi:hypothetical protein
MSVLSAEDTTHCTPIQLAWQKNHMFLARYMERAKRRHEEKMRYAAGLEPWSASSLLSTQPSHCQCPLKKDEMNMVLVLTTNSTCCSCQ